MIEIYIFIIFINDLLYVQTCLLSFVSKMHLIFIYYSDCYMVLFLLYFRRLSRMWKTYVYFFYEQLYYIVARLLSNEVGFVMLSNIELKLTTELYNDDLQIIVVLACRFIHLGLHEEYFFFCTKLFIFFIVGKYCCVLLF